MEIVSWLDRPHEWKRPNWIFCWTLVSGVLYLHRDPHDWVRLQNGWQWEDIECAGYVVWNDPRWGTVWHQHGAPHNADWQTYNAKAKAVANEITKWIEAGNSYL